MRISLIAAISESPQGLVIGRDNQLPWQLPGDLPRLKRLTTGHAIIMGRKTFESIGRVLPKRENIILTRRRDFAFPGATVMHSLDDALAHCESNGETEAFIFGGGEIYRQAMPRVQRMYLTRIHQVYEGDAFFPDIPADFVETSREDHAGPTPFSYVVMERGI